MLVVVRPETSGFVEVAGAADVEVMGCDVVVFDTAVLVVVEDRVVTRAVVVVTWGRVVVVAGKVVVDCAGTVVGVAVPAMVTVRVTRKPS